MARSKGFDRYGWWLNEWGASTARAEMTLAERGAFRELCEAQYKLAGREDGEQTAQQKASKTGSKGLGRLAADDRTLARFVGCQLDEWLAVKDRVLREFDKVDGGYSNHKVVKEIEFTLKKRRGGQASWGTKGRAKRGTNTLENGEPSSSSSLEEDEDPLTPTSGGTNESAKGEQKKETKPTPKATPTDPPINPRARGTNPRARADVAAKKAHEDDQWRRAKLIGALSKREGAELADSTKIEEGGIYDPGSGMVSWNSLKTERLEEINQELEK